MNCTGSSARCPERGKAAGRHAVRTGRQVQRRRRVRAVLHGAAPAADVRVQRDGVPVSALLPSAGRRVPPVQPARRFHDGPLPAGGHAVFDGLLRGERHVHRCEARARAARLEFPREHDRLEFLDVRQEQHCRLHGDPLAPPLCARRAPRLPLHRLAPLRGSQGRVQRLHQA